MLVPITCYRCDRCKRIYEEAPNRCVCERTIYVVGERTGSFIILDKGEQENYFLVRCILCGTTSELYYTNMKRQKSCGCKPLHIKIESISTDSLAYTCKRCNKTSIIKPPVVTYCCETTEDEMGEDNNGNNNL